MKKLYLAGCLLLTLASLALGRFQSDPLVLAVALGCVPLAALLPTPPAAGLLWVASQSPGLAALAALAALAWRRRVTRPSVALPASVLVCGLGFPGPAALLYALLHWPVVLPALGQGLLAWVMVWSSEPPTLVLLLLASVALAWPLPAPREDPPELIEEARQQLARAAGRLEDVGQWTSRLLEAPEPSQVILEIALSQQPCQTVALFLADRGQLVPVAARTPFRQRLSLDLPEPIVQEAYQRGQPLHRVQLEGERLFPDETPAIALPLGEVGVLYMGRPQADDFSPEVLERLSRLAPLAARALLSAGEHQSLLRARQRFELLTRLLEGVRLLAGSLDERSLEAGLENASRNLVEHRGGLFWRDGALSRRWGDPFEPPSLEGPRMEDNLLVAPCGVGLLVLSGQHFNRDQLTALCLLGSLAALSFENAARHRELQEAQGQLLLAGKMSAVGQLAAGVAHEINNPLMALSTDAEMLAIETDPDERTAILEGIRMSVGRCRQITSELLSFAREGVGQPTSVPLAPLVDGLRRRLGGPIEYRGEELSVLARPEEVQQILVTLIHNAQLAGARRVEVSAQRQGPEVSVEVRDDGCGMSPEVQERIFEPFFTTREVGQGTGMGLFLAYTMARSLQGRLELVESAPGKGSRFLLVLPGS
ncbi:hypothetical protein DYH09_25735 [bacterium CPR1]|nr:hypothetical protein [bacterium CPR1]